jgi:hypothetical protein
LHRNHLGFYQYRGCMKEHGQTNPGSLRRMIDASTSRPSKAPDAAPSCRPGCDGGTLQSGAGLTRRARRNPWCPKQGLVPRSMARSSILPIRQANCAGNGRRGPEWPSNDPGRAFHRLRLSAACRGWMPHARLRVSRCLDLAANAPECRLQLRSLSWCRSACSTRNARCNFSSRRSRW